jgi:hypothetical protein
LPEIDPHLPGSLKPDEKVRLCIEMTDVVTHICADGIRKSHPRISERELISILRRRFSFGRAKRSNEEKALDTFEVFVRRVVGALNRSGLQYALTGGVAASYYGRPRTTLDVDVLVVTKESELGRLAKSLTDEGIKAGTRELIRAWKSKYRIASVADSKSPHRLDIIFTDRRLEREAGLVLGAHTYYQTAESLILSNLRMIKATLLR